MLVITGSFKYRDQVFPVYLIHCHIVLTLHFHELITLYEGLLMKVVGIALIVYHADLTLVFRHEHVNITIQRITVIPAADYLTIYAEPCISYREAQEGSRSCEDR